jgi:hypothetical protein
MLAMLTARLCPSNDQAAQTGVVSGTVSNMMTGKGRFQVNCMGEVLTGEATRVSNEDKRAWPVPTVPGAPACRAIAR